MEKLKNLFRTLDNWLIRLLLIFFVFFIPLYPKFPLSHIEYTYIYVRLDDILIGVITAIFLVQLIRAKITLNRAFIKPILFFWAVVFLSLVWNMYVSKFLPYHQLALLHALRRIEYLIIFFVASSAIKTRKDFSLILFALFASFSTVIAYGLGQKFFGFPAVQTMNPAFAAGQILPLTPEARISALFGGHYDLAAYLVLLMSIVLGLHFSKKSLEIDTVGKIIVAVIGFFIITWVSLSLMVTSAWIIILITSLPLLLLLLTDDFLREKILFFFAIIGGILLLIFTASRISIIAFIASTPFLALFLKKYKYFIFIILLTLCLSFASKNVSSRFSKTFQFKQILRNSKTGAVYIPQTISIKELPAGSAYTAFGKSAPRTKESKLEMDRILREATASGRLLSEAQRQALIASLSANIKPVSAIVTDISFATRLQVEWPRALAALKMNPVLGTGPSSITESTDNDFLRWLGEFGLLGFSATVFIIFSISKFIFLKIKSLDPSLRPLFYGVLFGIFGLLINAMYIDVFEASKVAYIFWLTMGITTSFLGNLYES